MEFMFPIVILAAGLILIFSLSKENKVFFLAGGYFLVLGAWLLVDRIYPDAGAFAGGWGIAFRVLTAAVLVVLAVVFVKEYRKNRKSARGHHLAGLGRRVRRGGGEPQHHPLRDEDVHHLPRRQRGLRLRRGR